MWGLLYEPACNMGRYFTSTRKYFHELKVSENKSLRDKYNPHIVTSVMNCLFIHWIFFKNSKHSEETLAYF